MAELYSLVASLVGAAGSADYILRYRPDYPIALIEAKAEYRSAQDGVQQARDYTEVLGLRFAYASNGREIIEIDLTAGTEHERADFSTPAELWNRQRNQLDLSSAAAETTPGRRRAARRASGCETAAVFCSWRRTDAASCGCP